LCFVVAWLLVEKFAPMARGSGIPQVMAAIALPASGQNKAIKLLLSLRIIIVKIVSSLLMVVGGGAIGREGPTIQIASSVFSLFHKWLPAGIPRLAAKSYYITGAAAGLAAAFNTPLGGVVFAIEELARIHVSFFRTALFAAVIIAGLTAQTLAGPYLYLGYPDASNLSHAAFAGVAVTAILAGYSGAGTAKMILKIMEWRNRLTRNQTLLFTVAIGLSVASIAFFANPHILGSGKELMNKVLFTADKHTSASTLLMRILGPVLCFNAGAAGGIFAPSLAAGAAMGSFIAGLTNFVGANANIIILGGMVGFLTGVTRTPMTSAILVLEMTDRHSVIFHLMLAAMLASLAALLVDEMSFYERLRNKYLETLQGNANPPTPNVAQNTDVGNGHGF
jgi:H+/Cl- antiporter ClcA